MPQMMPLNWLILMMFFLMLMIIINNLIYFNKNFKLNSHAQSTKFMKLQKYNWMW